MKPIIIYMHLIKWSSSSGEEKILGLLSLSLSLLKFFQTQKIIIAKSEPALTNAPNPLDAHYDSSFGWILTWVNIWFHPGNPFCKS
jgi:hypothetical protein